MCSLRGHFSPKRVLERKASPPENRLRLTLAPLFRHPDPLVLAAIPEDHPHDVDADAGRRCHGPAITALHPQVIRACEACFERIMPTARLIARFSDRHPACLIELKEEAGTDCGAPGRGGR